MHSRGGGATLPMRPRPTTVATHSGQSMPPAKARYVRQPLPSTLPMSSTEPAGADTGVQYGTGSPLSVAVMWAPVSANTVGWCSFSFGPCTVSSSPVAVSSLPTSRCAMRIANGSIGPLMGTPTFQYLERSSGHRHGEGGAPTTVRHATLEPPTLTRRGPGTTGAT